MREDKIKSWGKKSKSILAILIFLIILIAGTGCSTGETSTTISNQAKVDSNENKNSVEHIKPLKVTFIDVGQADSILIQIPNGKNILIDAGNNEDAEQIITFLKNQGIRRLDSVIGTHPHEDHIGSLDKVIKTFEIGEILMPKVTTNTQTFKDVLTAVQDKGLKIKEAKAGIKLDWGAEVLAPISSKYEDLNNYSVVLRFVYGQNVFLFTGDAEEVSEREMISSSYSLKADVLKVGHHGSSSSTTPEFLKRVSPKYAVISVGKDNTYGHPAADIINRLKKSGAEVYRTDLMGTIVAESDGTQVTLTSK
jgi:competence protein ComEC